MQTEFVNLEFTHYSEMFMRFEKISRFILFCLFQTKQHNSQRGQVFSKDITAHFTLNQLPVSLCVYNTVQAICEQNVQGDGGYFVTKTNFICHGHMMH